MLFVGMTRHRIKASDLEIEASGLEIGDDGTFICICLLVQVARLA